MGLQINNLQLAKNTGCFSAIEVLFFQHSEYTYKMQTTDLENPLTAEVLRTALHQK